MIYMLFLNKPESVITKVHIYRKNGIQSPWFNSNGEHEQKLLVDVNWLHKVIWKLNKTLKGVLLCETWF